MPPAFHTYKPGYMQVFGCICLDPMGKVLLVQGKGSNKWSFPKGHKKRNETSIACARRELWEETGIEAPNTHTAYYKMKGGEYFVFEFDTNCDTFIHDTVEIQKTEWVPLNELPTMDTNIDVSIFRSHLRKSFNSPMKSVNPLTIKNFIGSQPSLRSVEKIQEQMKDSASMAKFFDSPLRLP